MSEYFALDGGNFIGNFIKPHDQSSTTDKFIMMFNVNQFDFFVAFLGFYIIRYVLPNSILGNDQSMRVGLIVAFCYAIFGFVRSGLLDYKKKLDIRSVGSSYY
tara:strand:+ start:537 stop:845 length:309 start_codon:yes stop_codon:yes gene_type:complete